MTMKTELNETERLSYEGALSRDRDPVVPRGAVVAGEPRELEGAEDLPSTWFCPDCGGAVTWAAAIADLAIAKSDLRAAQERIRALEARLGRVRGVVASAIVAAREGEGQPDTVRSNAIDLLNLDALTPEDREWAEGEET